LNYPECDLRFAHEIENLINYEDPRTVAALVVEPVMGAGGVIVPPDGYFDVIKKICQDNEVFLVADEVLNGFGRTGKMFASEHWNLKPDIFVMSKGITSGYLPLGAVGVTQSIYDQIWKGGSPFFHVFTSSGNPTVTALALKNIEIIEKENLVDNAAKMGAYLEQSAQSLLDLPHVGETRGIGLMRGIQVVEDKSKRKLYPANKRMAANVVFQALQNGLIVRALPNDTIGIAPVLTVNEEEIDTIIRIIGNLLEKF
jgi:putrescine aminotransferase